MFIKFVIVLMLSKVSAYLQIIANYYHDIIFHDESIYILFLEQIFDYFLLYWNYNLVKIYYCNQVKFWSLECKWVATEYCCNSAT